MQKENLSEDNVVGLIFKSVGGQLGKNLIVDLFGDKSKYKL